MDGWIIYPLKKKTLLHHWGWRNDSVLLTLPRDPNLVPGTHIRWLRTVSNCNSRDPVSSCGCFDYPQAWRVHSPTRTHTYKIIMSKITI